MTDIMTAEMVERVMAEIERHLAELDDDNPCRMDRLTVEYGLRCHHTADVEVGDILEPSWVWEDGEWTDEQLDGTCCIGISSRGRHMVTVHAREGVAEALRLVGDYRYTHTEGRLVLIASDNTYRGQDRGEIIARRAVVVAVL